MGRKRPKKTRHTESQNTKPPNEALNSLKDQVERARRQRKAVQNGILQDGRTKGMTDDNSKGERTEVRNDDYRQEESTEDMTDNKRQEERTEVMIEESQKDGTEDMTDDNRQDERNEDITDNERQDEIDEDMTDDHRQEERVEEMTENERQCGEEIAEGMTDYIQEERTEDMADDRQEERTEDMTGDNRQEERTEDMTGDNRQEERTEDMTGDNRQEERTEDMTGDNRQEERSEDMTDDERQEESTEGMTEDRQDESTENMTGDNRQEEGAEDVTDDETDNAREEERSEDMADDRQEERSEDMADDREEERSEDMTDDRQEERTEDMTGDREEDRTEDMTGNRQEGSTEDMTDNRHERRSKDITDETRHGDRNEGMADNGSRWYQDDDVTPEGMPLKTKEPRHEKTNTVDSDQNPDEEVIDDSEAMASGGNFQFSLDMTQWNEIKPEIKQYAGALKITKRRLQRGWTQMFALETNKIYPGCVLAFKEHRVKLPNSRKIDGPFITSKAICKGPSCYAKFNFTIQDEPVEPINEQATVEVFCNVEGNMCHVKDEVNRRNITGVNRQHIANNILKSSASAEFNKLLLEADDAELQQGNFSAAPNPTVLRKIVSEQIQREYLHSNIMQELQIIKEHDQKLNDPYIRDLGLDPFTVIMFNERQRQLLKQLSRNDSLNIYIDATGTVIHTIHGQKVPYLYSMVVRPQEDLPPVSVADMISTQHTVPRIELFLNTVKRCLNIAGEGLNVKKSESDFSFPLLQACLKTFTGYTLKEYIIHCYNVIGGQKSNSKTVHHLCASHMLRDYMRKIASLNIAKRVRYLAIQAFGALQNTVTINETKLVFEEICHIFLNESKSERCRKAETTLSQKARETECSDESEDIEDENVRQIDEDDDCQRKTIKEASPFTAIFNDIAEEVTKEAAKDDAGTRNEFYCPAVVNILTQKYMPLVPLWSGLMLGTKTVDGDLFAIARDTNSIAESWFKYIKHDIGAKARARPSKFVIDLKVAIESRLKLMEFPGADKRKTRKPKSGQAEADKNLNTKEEVWKTRGKRNVFHKTPSAKVFPGQKLPNVMRWGGRRGATSLSNTCTIDNGLTILHLAFRASESFRNFLTQDKSELSKTLINIFARMDKEEFSEAKFMWLDFTKCNRVDLFGDEFDFFTRHINCEWESRCRSKCGALTCPEPMMEIRETPGITIGIQGTFNDIQRLVDIWLNDKNPCMAVLSTDDASQTQDSSTRCPGQRVIQRELIRIYPIMILRVYEHFLARRLTLDNMLNSVVLMVNEQRFQLAGLVLHSGSHYSAITMVNGSRNWYDGLHGNLTTVPRNLNTWRPVNAIYMRIM